MRETTALGAAIAAGLAAGIWRNFTELRNINRAGGTVFEPTITKEQSAERFSLWEKAVQMSKGWSSSSAADAAAKKVATQPAIRLAEKGDGVEASTDVFGDLNAADEEDLLLELRKIEIQQRLKRLRTS
jgi:glycerol kinase